jgi:MFS family permease
MSNTANTIIGFLIILVALPLFILWLRDRIRQASAMRYSKAQAVGMVSAYILGVLFFIIGVLTFWTGLEQGPSLPNPIASRVFDVALAIFGLITWVATWLRYGGGFWSIIGGFLVAGAFAGTVSIIETHMRGWHFNSPVAFYTRIAACWVVGSVFLFIGHRRHCKKKQVLPNTVLEPL